MTNCPASYFKRNRKTYFWHNRFLNDAIQKYTHVMAHELLNMNWIILI